MSTMELLEQVRYLPLEEKRKFFGAIHEVEKEVAVEEPKERHVINPPDFEAYRRKLAAIGSIDWDEEQLENFDRWLAGEDVEDPPDRYVPDDSFDFEKMSHELFAKATRDIREERAKKLESRQIGGKSTAE